MKHLHTVAAFMMSSATQWSHTVPTGEAKVWTFVIPSEELVINVPCMFKKEEQSYNTTNHVRGMGYLV